MSIIFKPYGALDVNTDPSGLEQGSDGTNIISGEMQRCKNLRINENQIAKTRYGISSWSPIQLSAPIYHLRVEYAGYTTFAFGASVYRNGVSIGSGYEGTAWSSIGAKPYNGVQSFIFALDGDVGQVRISISGTVYEWGIGQPLYNPILNVISGGSLTGDYNLKYTFVRKEGSTVVCESNPSAAYTSAASLSSQTLQAECKIYNAGVFDVYDSSLAITHLRAYRTLANGSIYYLDQDLSITGGTRYYVDEVDGLDTNDGSELAPWKTKTHALTQVDNGDRIWIIPSAGNIYELFIIETTTSDGSLGAEVATNHNQPPIGRLILGPVYNGIYFILTVTNEIYFSLPKQPEYWPLSYYIEVGDPYDYLKSGAIYNQQLYAITRRNIYLISGTDAETFFPLSQEALTGSVSRTGVCSVAGIGIFHIGIDGIYLFNGVVDKKITKDKFEKLFNGETCGAIPGVDANKLDNSIIVKYKNNLYFGYCSSTNTYPQHFIVFDLSNLQAIYYDWGKEITAVTVDLAYGACLIAVDSSGYLWRLEDQSQTDDNGTAISWDIMSKDFTLSTRAHFPRWVKYDVDASSANSATGELWLDGSNHQSHTLSANRSVKRRLVDVGNGNRCALRVSGTGPVSIHMIESE